VQPAGALAQVEEGRAGAVGDLPVRLEGALDLLGEPGQVGDALGDGPGARHGPLPVLEEVAHAHRGVEHVGAAEQLGRLEGAALGRAVEQALDVAHAPQGQRQVLLDPERAQLLGLLELLAHLLAAREERAGETAGLAQVGLGARGERLEDGAPLQVLEGLGGDRVHAVLTMRCGLWRCLLESPPGIRRHGCGIGAAGVPEGGRADKRTTGRWPGNRQLRH
jgi:hypothetical protein